MKQRINLLIAFSVIALIVLSTVQCYLVKTTYDYKVAQFHTEIKNKIAGISNDYSDIDSVIVAKKEALFQQLSENYIQGKNNKFRRGSGKPSGPGMYSNSNNFFRAHRFQYK